ncbi:hypothetical protein [Flavobacterium sp. HSC-61S13]|uniref:hypothetical protein n=1 Tax=Flavobacterium sp. HSC-61S13 TaxID=2910963 RepID=UPI00209E8C11|nr:hypothetical protein [Flavobacterium sp. HSC-61S13]MCP1997294.1 hypothetical protein [Flavobacterium sp. HSC-61S13]
MAIEVEIWAETIEKKLLEDNSFLNHIADVSSDNIINGSIVHLPQAGEPSAVVKNRQSLPAVVKQRKDTEVLYKIDEYTSDPVHIKNAETKELSYDKRRSVLDQDLANLSEEVAEGMLTNLVVSPVGDNKELPKANIILTSSAIEVDSAVGTGKRKAYSLTDLQYMRKDFVKKKAWTEGNMFALLTAEAITQMFPADSPITATYMQATSEAERRAGIIYKVQGWSIMERSSVYILGSDKGFKAFGAVEADTDSEGCLFWNKNMTEKAIGTTEAFERIGDPTYYGDIYSFLVRCGGRARRKGYEGVGILMQSLV